MILFGGGSAYWLSIAIGVGFPRVNPTYKSYYKSYKSGDRTKSLIENEVSQRSSF